MRINFNNPIKTFINKVFYYNKFDYNYRKDLNIIHNIKIKYYDKINNNDVSRYLWRSVCQYKSLSSTRPYYSIIFANLLALFSIPALLFYLRPKCNNNNRPETTYLKIDFHMAYQIPHQIREFTQEKKTVKKYIILEDLCFVSRLFIKNKAFYPELYFKLLLWIVKVRPHIDACKFKYLLQYCEYSPYSSLRKSYLNNNGILIANVSHGEEYISCRSSFSSFDQYFAWNITPRDIHNAMEIEYAEYFTFNPCYDYPTAPVIYDKHCIGVLWPSTFYIPIDILASKIENISKKYKVVIRPHPNPLYSNKLEIYRQKMDVEISYANKENIHSFIDRCNIIVGGLSAVMIQSALRERDVVYIKDLYLIYLQEYHKYYQSVNTVDVEEIDKYIDNYISNNKINDWNNNKLGKGNIGHLKNRE